MIPSILAWLTSAASWSGPSGIWVRLGEHLIYTVATLAIASAIALPIGLWVGHTGRGRWIVTSTNASRAVPSLGLLFAVWLWLSPYLRGQTAFVGPSLVVLVLLAVPPLLSGTYAGVEAVDPAARDAARGMGMRGREVLTKVELPCALPLVISGLRSATLQVIATATIASYISLGGLGRFLIDGQAATDYAEMAGGAVLVALLALLADLSLAAAGRFAVSPGLVTRSTSDRILSSRRAPA